MADQVEGQINAPSNANAAQEAPSPIPAHPAIAGKEHIEGSAPDCRCKNLGNCNDLPHWTRYIEVACAVLLVIITCAYTIYAGKQASAAMTAANAAKSAADTASATLKEMRNGQGAADTHTLAAQAVTQAEQTTNLAKDTHALARAAGRQADAAKTTSDSIKVQVAAQQRSTQLVEGLAMPHIVLVQMDLQQPVQAMKETRLLYKFINAGGTIADHVNCLMNHGFRASGDEPNFIFIPSTGSNMSIGAQQPFDCVPVTIPIGNDVDISKLQSKRIIFNVTAQISYEDMFHRKHVRQFCMELFDPTGTELIGCKNQGQSY